MIAKRKIREDKKLVIFLVIVTNPLSDALPLLDKREGNTRSGNQNTAATGPEVTTRMGRQEKKVTQQLVDLQGWFRDRSGLAKINKFTEKIN